MDDVINCYNEARVLGLTFLAVLEVDVHVE